MGLFGSGGDVSDHLGGEPTGDHVTEKRIRKIDDLLETNEKVHFMTAGSTIDAAGDESGTSLFGNDRAEVWNDRVCENRFY